MDELDREIEQAASAARRKVWRGRLATIASTATFFVVAIGGTIVMLTLFPEPSQSELDAARLEHKLAGEEPTAATLASDYSAQQRDQSRTRWKVVPVFALAFASAILVSRHFKPKN